MWFDVGDKSEEFEEEEEEEEAANSIVERRGCSHKKVAKWLDYV